MEIREQILALKTLKSDVEFALNAITKRRTHGTSKETDANCARDLKVDFSGLNELEARMRNGHPSVNEKGFDGDVDVFRQVIAPHLAMAQGASE